MTDVTVILTAHHEGIMAGVSLRSMLEAVENARQAGYEIEVLIVLDDPNEATSKAFPRFDENLQVFEVDFKDQGKTRNFGAQQSSGRLLAFIDADDLWSFNWLRSAIPLCTDDNTVIHPEFNYFFGTNNNIFVQIDDRNSEYDVELLRVANYWDALCLASRELHWAYPYCDRDIASGFAYEDWHWNCLTAEKGVRHQVAADTIHFKRRREGSQGSHSRNRNAIVRPTGLSSYGWYPRGSDPEGPTEVEESHRDRS